MLTSRLASRPSRSLLLANHEAHIHYVQTARQQKRWRLGPPPSSRPTPRRRSGRPAQMPIANRNITRSRPLQKPSQPPPTPGPNAQVATALASSESSDLVSEVHIPSDPHSVLPPSHPALSILSNSALVIQRQLELMNVMLGFEQANRYIIMNGQGETVGYIAERDHGIGSMMGRQMFATHRSFTAHILDAQQREVLRIHRPFAWINSRIRIYDCVPEGGYEAHGEASVPSQGTDVVPANDPAAPTISPLKLEEMRIIGETQQQWAPLRRKYNIFTYRPLTPPQSSTSAPNTSTAITESTAPNQAIESGMKQFAHISEPFLSWDFSLRSETQQLIGSVNRNFGGFAREIFTDTGVYALRMDSAAQTSTLEAADGKEVATYERDATAMTLDQRAVMLATAVSIDFDYFSRHSGSGAGGFMPLWMYGGSGAAGESAGAAGAAGAASGVVEGAAGAAGPVTAAAGRGLAGAGVADSGIAGAGTIAGYEAMRRGAYGQDDASPTNAEPIFEPDQQAPSQSPPPQGDESKDPWGGGGGNDPPPPPDIGGGSGGEGGGSIFDFFE